MVSNFIWISRKFRKHYVIGTILLQAYDFQELLTQKYNVIGLN